MTHVPVIRPANRDDIISFRGEPYEQSFRGIAVDLDGKVLGIAGVLHTSSLQLFSSIDDELRKYPKTIVKSIFTLKDLLEQYYQGPIYAFASATENNAPKILSMIGFEHIKEDMYSWVQSQFHYK